MTTSEPTTKTPACPFAGYALTTDKHAVFITAQVAGDERHYIIPAREFSRFVFGSTARGINRDLLNDGRTEESQSVQLVWECGVPYIHDLYNDPIGEWRLNFSIDGLTDLYVIERPFVFLGGRERVRFTRRVDDELRSQMWREANHGFTAPCRCPVVSS